MSDPLKPCPRCGGNLHTVHTSWQGSQQISAKITHCCVDLASETTVWGGNTAAAIAAWNRRTQEQTDG